MTDPSVGLSPVPVLLITLGLMVAFGNGFVPPGGARVPSRDSMTNPGSQQGSPMTFTSLSSSDRSLTRMMARAPDETKGVVVDLSDYKSGALKIKVKRLVVTEEQIEKSLTNFKKPYTLVPVRFVEEGGTKIGHTVIMNWEAKVGGAPVRGAKKENFELELKEGQPAPWNTFVDKMAVGMGQMETKVFPVDFSDDFEIEGLRGKNALVQTLVKSIARREDKPPETRSDDELRAILRAKGDEKIKAETDQLVDAAIKKALLQSCDVNADGVINSVSWAKFGEKSAQDFKWNCIKEKIASVEGIEARDVVAMLRDEATVEFMGR